MWVFRQVDGVLLRVAATPQREAAGYSGHGAGRNNPTVEQVPMFGPIPRGAWLIGAPQSTVTPGPHGPFVLPLAPAADTRTYGRGGFLIHGDSIEHPGEASEGCIILARDMRERIAASGDAVLWVI